MPKFENPWGETKNFVDLGPFKAEGWGQTVDYDLYALTHKSNSISFGARYSNEPHAYLSGCADYIDGEWRFYGSTEIIVAIARFFSKYVTPETIKTHKKVS